MDPRTARALAPALDARRCDLAAGADRRVVLAATGEPISDRKATQLRNFVRRGGGLVLLGGTLAAWSESEAIRDIAGWVPAGASAVTEIVLRAGGRHPVTRSLGPEWRRRARPSPPGGGRARPHPRARAG